MSSDLVHTRKDDGPIYRWLPVVATIVAVGVAWGAMTTQMAGFEKTLVEQSTALRELRHEVRNMRDAGIRTESDLGRIEEQLAESRVAREILTNLARNVGVLEGDQERTRVSIQRLWNLGRANQANLSTIRNLLIQKGYKVPPLKEPDLLAE